MIALVLRVDTVVEHLLCEASTNEQVYFYAVTLVGTGFVDSMPRERVMSKCRGLVLNNLDIAVWVEVQHGCFRDLVAEAHPVSIYEYRKFVPTYV